LHFKNYILTMIAKDGYSIIIPLALVTAAVWGAYFTGSRHWWLAGFGLVLAVFTGFCLYFFRDPERAIPEGKNLVLAPADGRVVDVSEAEEPFFAKQKMRKISIFLSVFNVHVNRMPVSGKVVYKKYYPGTFLDARVEKASLDNEQMHVGLETEHGPVLVKQIAGLIARRVVCRAQVGQIFPAGERFGMLKFGSRTDLFLPLSATVRVKVGDRVAGGTTVMGEFNAQ
jgi:phosphatidylserine decarboxylase